jgi:hypothetical protein
MGLLGPVVGILGIIMNNSGHQLTTSNAIAAQFICHNLSRLIAMTAQQPLEEALRGCAVPTSLEKHINDFTILIDCSPKVMLLAIDLHEDFVDVKGIAVSSVLSL